MIISMHTKNSRFPLKFEESKAPIEKLGHTRSFKMLEKYKTEEKRSGLVHNHDYFEALYKSTFKKLQNYIQRMIVDKIIVNYQVFRFMAF